MTKDFKELKTLEDISEDRNLHLDEYPIAPMAELLKQEAIKWIKHNLAMDKKFNEPSYEILMGEKTYKEPVQWIKHFFNIDEEELK